MASNNYEQHKFFCIKCANETIPVQRKVNHQHRKHHLKRLWCPHCKITINCVECRNEEEVEEFKEKWKAGFYTEEVEKSLIENAKENLLWS